MIRYILAQRYMTFDLPGLRKSSNGGMQGEYGEPAPPFSNFTVVTAVVTVAVDDTTDADDDADDEEGTLLFVRGDCAEVVVAAGHGVHSRNRQKTKQKQG